MDIYSSSGTSVGHLYYEAMENLCMIMRFLEDRKCQFIQGKEEDEREVQSIEKNSHVLKQRM